MPDAAELIADDPTQFRDHSPSIPCFILQGFSLRIGAKLPSMTLTNLRKTRDFAQFPCKSLTNRDWRGRLLIPRLAAPPLAFSETKSLESGLREIRALGFDKIGRTPADDPAD